MEISPSSILRAGNAVFAARAASTSEPGCALTSNVTLPPGMLTLLSNENPVNPSGNGNGSGLAMVSPVLNKRRGGNFRTAWPEGGRGCDADDPRQRGGGCTGGGGSIGDAFGRPVGICGGPAAGSRSTGGAVGSGTGTGSASGPA